MFSYFISARHKGTGTCFLISYYHLLGETQKALGALDTEDSVLKNCVNTLCRELLDAPQAVT